MSGEEFENLPQIHFEDWYNSRVWEKLDSFKHRIKSLQDAYKYGAVSQSDYNKISDTIKDAFKKARILNYEIFTRRLNRELQDSPDIDRKIDLERRRVEEVLEEYQEAYREFLGGRTMMPLDTTYCCKYVFDQYEAFQKATNEEKERFKPIVNLYTAPPNINLDGSVEDFSYVDDASRLMPKNPMVWDLTLFVATYDDYRRYIESLLKSSDKTFNAATISLIIHYLQAANVIEPATNVKALRPQLEKFELLDRNYDGTDNAGNVRNKLNSIRKNHKDDPREHPINMKQAINFLRQKDYDEAKSIAKKDQEEFTGLSTD
jgi:hypothetical protein